MTNSAEPTTFKQGRYEVTDVLGRGLFSTVYKVYDEENDKSYALKALGLANHDRDIAESMFKKEVDALRGFKQEGVVQLIESFTERKTGVFCIVLELVPGAKSLDQVIRDVSQGVLEPYPLEWCLEQLKILIAVLDQAHHRHIVHRDIKPGNLLVGSRGGQRFMKLADFGIARVIEHYGREGGMTLPQFATVPYAAPEQVNNQETSYASDYYAFGVTLLSLLTWRLSTQPLEGTTLEQAIEALPETITDSESCRIIIKLVRDLLQPDPGVRPKPPTILRSLETVLNRIVSKPRVGVKITQAARERIDYLGITVAQFLGDLNEHTVAEYQENEHRGEKKVNVAFYGRSTMAFTVADRNNPEQLVLVDARVEQPYLHQRRREGESMHLCPYEILEGADSAYTLLNEFYQHYVHDLAAKQRYTAKEDLLEASLFILGQLESDAIELIISYRQVQRQKYDDILAVEVLSVISTDREGLEAKEVLDDEIIQEWIESLSRNASFGLQQQGRKGVTSVGTFRDYNRYTRELSLNLTSQKTIPAQGRLVCQNIAQLASNQRQRFAVDRFLSDDTVNPRLSELLLKPGLNALDERKPVSLIQALEPEQMIQDVIERATAANDFFLIQGPPGTGKTTLIAEIIMQLLKRAPETRILVTAQANPAVDNAMEKLQRVTAEKGMDVRTLRLTRSRMEQGVDEFKDSFSAWVEQTRLASKKGVKEIADKLEGKAQTEVLNAVKNWQEKLTWAEDVKRDYAQSVQVYGVTCLRAPTLWELLRKVEFDWVIIDEAAKAMDTEVLVPIVHGRRVIMVGDQRQLPPYVDTDIALSMKSEGIDPEEAQTSLFEKVFDLIQPSNRMTLRRQYRMHRSIGDFVGRLFYHDIGGLETGVADADREINIKSLNAFESRVFWFNVSTGIEAKVSQGTSYYNDTEASKINSVLELLNDELKRSSSTYSVGIITPYTAQVDVLKSRIVPASRLWTNLDIEISTVDAFQGKENDITVYSMVRTKPGSLRFVEDIKRLNVSFSRAKRALLIFGHRQTAQASSIFAQVLKLIPDKNFIGGSEDANKPN